MGTARQTIFSFGLLLVPGIGLTHGRLERYFSRRFSYVGSQHQQVSSCKKWQLSRLAADTHSQYLQQFPAAENRDFLLESDAEKVATASASSDPSQNQEIELERSLLRQALANIESHFSEQTWRAFWMVVVEGRETNDVAADLAMRPGTVRVAKSRVLKRLRLEVGDSLD